MNVMDKMVGFSDQTKSPSTISSLTFASYTCFLLITWLNCLGETIPTFLKADWFEDCRSPRFLWAGSCGELVILLQIGWTPSLNVTVFISKKNVFTQQVQWFKGISVCAPGWISSDNQHGEAQLPPTHTPVVFSLISFFLTGHN